MKIIYNVKAMEGGFLVKEGIRREYKKQYDASTKRIDVVDVPEFNFLMVDGIGNPNVEEFKLKAEALHILSKAIKDYFKEEMDLLYLISPLEGLWDTYDNSQFDVTRKKMIKFTLMIAQPKVLDEQTFETIKENITVIKFLRIGKISIEIYGGVIMYMAIGLCLGVAFGTALDNLPLGIAIGVAVGAGIDSSRSSKRKKDKEDEEDEDL